MASSLVGKKYGQNTAAKEDGKQLKEKTTPQIAETPRIKLDISFEDWQKRLAFHYENLQRITKENFPTVWPALEFVISISRILNIKDCSLPFMGIILGKPSSFKTFGIELLRGIPGTIYTDQFTAKSFVSHINGVDEEKLKEIDLLPKIKNKVFLTPELSPTFSAREEDLTNILGIITRLLDGHGFESDSGAQGHRGYSGEFMFTWIGAAVEIPRRVHKLLSSLGPKLYFFRLHVQEKDENGYYEQMEADNFKEKRQEIQSALTQYLEWFSYCPSMELDGNVHKFRMEKEDKEVALKVIRFAKLLAHLRGSVPTWESDDTQGSHYAYSVATIEDPSRAITQLRNLARGHALAEGRKTINDKDLAILANVMLSTAPVERVVVFDLLLAHKGTLKTSDITRGMNTTNPTARRTMVELKALELVDMSEPSSQTEELQITLKDDFKWFLTEEFSAIRRGEISFKQLERKTPPSEEGAGDSIVARAKNKSKLPVFWQIFDTMSKASSDNEVDSEALKRELITSGKFDAGEAYQVVKDCLSENVIYEFLPGRYRRAT